jgi:hypothetical protein
MDSDDRTTASNISPGGTSISRGGRLDKALARASGAPLRVGNKLKQDDERC